MWWVQPRSRTPSSAARRQAGRHGVGVQRRPPVRQRRVRAQGVAPQVAGPEVPVQVPHVLAPAEHLPDEALRARPARTSPARNAASAARTTSSGCSRPRLSGTDSSECAIAQSSCSIASSCGPKCGRRCATKCASARRASSAVTANQRGPSRPIVGRSRASRSARTRSSISSSGGCHGCDQAERPLPLRRWLAVLVVVGSTCRRPARRPPSARRTGGAGSGRSPPSGRSRDRPPTPRSPRAAARTSASAGSRRRAPPSAAARRTAARRARSARGRRPAARPAPAPRGRCRCAGSVRAVAQLGGEVAHAREHQVQLLAVEALPAQHPRSTRRARPRGRGARRSSARAGRVGRRRATAARRSCRSLAHSHLPRACRRDPTAQPRQCSAAVPTRPAIYARACASSGPAEFAEHQATTPTATSPAAGCGPRPSARWTGSSPTSRWSPASAAAAPTGTSSS